MTETYCCMPGATVGQLSVICSAKSLIQHCACAIKNCPCTADLTAATAAICRALVIHAEDEEYNVNTRLRPLPLSTGLY